MQAPRLCYPMPRQPSAPPGAGRIFARIDRFDVECPDCGKVIAGGLTGRARLTAQKRIRTSGQIKQATAYNPVTSTLRCPFCGRLYQVGLILWPLHRSTRGWSIPQDQRPTTDQMRQLRQYAKGFVARDHKRRGDAVNVHVTAECLCPIAAGGWAPACPIHGWPAVAKQVEEENQK